MRAKISVVLRTNVAQNTLALYGSMFIHYLLPLVTLPYLARMLGPEVWGLIAFIQVIGTYLALVVNYSLDLSGGRTVARYRDDAAKLSETVAGVLGARLMLAVVCVAVLAVLQALVPAIRDTGALLWLGAFWYLATALRPFWFFLGIERVRGFLVLEVSLKALTVPAILLLVNAPTDAWKVLAIQGVAAVLTTAVGMSIVYRLIPLRGLSVLGALRSLREGWDLFVLSALTSVYTMSNTIILGFLTTPLLVGYYAGAERISRMLTSLMSPLVMAMFPRASGLAKDDPLVAARATRMTILSLFVLAATSAASLYFLAPTIIRILLGVDYSEAVPVLRILLLLLPLIGVSFPLTTQWMIPIGLERLLTKVTLSSSLLHVLLAVSLGSRFAHIGVAWALVITETFQMSLLMLLLYLRGLNPFGLPSQVKGVESAPVSLRTMRRE